MFSRRRSLLRPAGNDRDGVSRPSPAAWNGIVACCGHQRRSSSSRRRDGTLLRQRGSKSRGELEPPLEVPGAQAKTPHTHTHTTILVRSANVQPWNSLAEVNDVLRRGRGMSGHDSDNGDALSVAVCLSVLQMLESEIDRQETTLPVEATQQSHLGNHSKRKAELLSYLVF